jgi:hypothetical protein
MFGAFLADEGFTAPRIRFGLHPMESVQAQPKLVGWRHTHHEIDALEITPTVWAFAADATTMPSADFCRAIGMAHAIPSRDSATRHRSPEVSSTAFRAQPPDLRFASLMDVGFAIMCPLVRPRMPPIRFCSSARAYAPRFFQTLPRGPALALR